MNRLSEKEILQKLQNLDGWTLNEAALERNFKFENFKQSLDFINQLGTAAEEQNHHPELFNVYNKVNIRLSTHDADGITEKDFKLANTINSFSLVSS